jgi:hypothetical protein
MIMNVPHSGAYVIVAGAVSIASIAAAAAVEIVKTRTGRSQLIRRRETRHVLAKRVEKPEIALLLDTLDETITAGRCDTAMFQATWTALLRLSSEYEEPHQIGSPPAVSIGDQSDRPADSSDGNESADDEDGLSGSAMLLIRIN